jgi:hypothetical protein
MSLASVYAEAVAAAALEVVSATATAPPPFVGPAGGRLEVSPTGNLRAVPASGPAAVEVPAAAVPAMIAWLTATFVT